MAGDCVPPVHEEFLLQVRDFTLFDEQALQSPHNQLLAVHAGMQLFEVVGEGVFTVEQSKVFVQVLFCVPNIEQDSQSPQDQVSALQDGVQA